MILKYTRMSMGLLLALAGLLVLSALLAACQVTAPAPFLSPPPKSALTSPGLPAPTIPVTSGTGGQPITAGLSAQNANYATLSGTVIEASGLPPTEVVMFLGPLAGDPEKFPVIAIDRQKSPSAIPSPITGKFIFVDVPPGTYGLVYWTPDASFLVKDLQNPALSLIVKLGPGDVKDIGTLHAPSH